jgi:AP-1 complex subunit gamma-1
LAHYYAALGPVRIVRKVPDLEENFMGLAASLLNAKHHGVLYLQFSSAGILCKDSKDAVQLYRGKNKKRR